MNMNSSQHHQIFNDGLVKANIHVPFVFNILDVISQYSNFAKNCQEFLKP